MLKHYILLSLISVSYLGFGQTFNSGTTQTDFFTEFNYEWINEKIIIPVEIEGQTFIAPSKQTLSQYVGKWLDEVAVLRVSAHTLVSYRQMMATHVLPQIGGRRLDALTTGEIQAVYARMTGGGSSPRLVRYVHTVLKQALKKAAGLRLLTLNPADYVTLPKQAASQSASNILTVEQVGKLLAVSKDTPMGTLWNLMLNSGLRPQEVFALEWTDLDERKLSVSKALVNDGHGGVAVGPTKTKSSRRTLTLASTTVAALQDHKTRQASAILKGGKWYGRKNLIFANQSGDYLDIAKVRKQWKDALQRAGLPAVRLYDTRHTHATLLLLAGVQVKAVSSRLGHATVNITLDTYAKWLPEMDQNAADALEQLMRRTA